MSWEKLPPLVFYQREIHRLAPEIKNPEILLKEGDKLKEKCAVFGVFVQNQQAAPLVHEGLLALQHRGQEASGIVAINDRNCMVGHKGEGLVSQVFRRSHVDNLLGEIAIGHNRYATSGGIEHVQPVLSEKGLVALSHNGTLPETKKLERFLKSKSIETKGLNDSELMQRALEHYVEQGMQIEDAVKEAFPLFTGAFALTIISQGKLIGVRDKHGIRPLTLGKIENGYVLSSETIGIESVGGEVTRDIEAGEMVVIDEKGVQSHQIAKGKEQLDIFEIIYFARPESILYGKKVNDMRVALGRKLAEETKYLWNQTDMVIGIPNSAIPAAAGYIEQSSIPYDPDALHKNSYIHRTFINPAPGGREQLVRRKFSAMESRLTGKRVTIVDDSIVRGPTLKVLVAMLKEAGAVEVNVVISSPPVKYPDFYGIDTPMQKDLIASRMSVEEIRQYSGADHLHFLSYKGMLEALGIPENRLCTSCFTGKYPISIGENRRSINFSV